MEYTVKYPFIKAWGHIIGHLEYYIEDQIAKAVILALFIPLIISSGGNSGSQASTLIIRALALGEITIRDWWKIIKKELATGLVIGLILGFIGFIRVAAWSYFIASYGPHWMLIALTVSWHTPSELAHGNTRSRLLVYLRGTPSGRQTARCTSRSRKTHS